VDILIPIVSIFLKCNVTTFPCFTSLTFMVCCFWLS
jgi:hypothetical protein